MLIYLPRWLCYGALLAISNSALPVYAEKVHEFQLDNGLNIFVKVDNRAPVAVSQVWYKIGSSYEPAGKTGLSHMLEHMMFKGTEKFPTGEFSRIMAENGASQNAFTGKDFTAYFQTIEKSRLATSFELEADRMQNLQLSAEELAKERLVVREERRVTTEDNPTRLLYEQFNATAYQTNPYRQPIIGWASDIDHYTIADLANWYQQWYAPNNASLVVIGDVQPQAVLELANTHFGDIPRRDIAPPVLRPEAPQLGMKRIVVKRPAELPFLVMGYKVPSLATIDSEQLWEVYALEVLIEVLDGDDSARLTRELVRGQEVATSAGAGYSLNSRLTTLLTLQGIPAEGHEVAELEAALRAQVTRLQTELVTAEELARIKTRLKASYVYEQDSMFYQGMKIGILETVGLSWRAADAYLTMIAAVTPAQIQQVAHKYLHDDGLTVAILEPQS